MTEEEMKRLRRLTKVHTKKELMEWALWLLQWVVHQHQRGCTIVAINEKASIYQNLNFPLLQGIDPEALTVPLSEYPTIVGEQLKLLIEAGRVQEAEEVVQVMKNLGKRSKKKVPQIETQIPSVSSTMNLEAAKVMAEEGDPRSALTLVEQNIQDSSTKK